MRWRQSFIAEVSRALQQFGLRACPICGSADALSIGRFPAFWLEGGPPSGDDDLSLGEDDDYDLTFAVRIECTACGHLMLFNASKYRTGDEPILVRDQAEEEGQLRERLPPEAGRPACPQHSTTPSPERGSAPSPP
jgi:hypothetical protein